MINATAQKVCREHGVDAGKLTAEIQQQIANLGFQMENCCCSIKTQMLQDKYDETVRELTKAQTDASNSAQSQYLLSVMGKWVANPAAVAVV
jgi:hypothetical protein